MNLRNSIEAKLSDNGRYNISKVESKENILEIIDR